MCPMAHYTSFHPATPPSPMQKQNHTNPDEFVIVLMLSLTIGGKVLMAVQFCTHLVLRYFVPCTQILFVHQ